MVCINCQRIVEKVIAKLIWHQVRILRGGPITTVNTLNRWQRQRSELEKTLEIESYYMEPTAIQLMVITFTVIIGLLQTLYIWGMAQTASLGIPDNSNDIISGLMIPYAVLTFFKGFVFFLHHVLKRTDWYSRCKARLHRSDSFD